MSFVYVSLEQHTLSVMDILRKAQISQEITDDILETFQESGHFGSLFPGLTIHYMQRKYCRDHFNLVVSSNAVILRNF